MHIENILSKLDRVLCLEKKAINEDHIYSIDRVFKIRVILIEKLLRYDLNKINPSKKKDIYNKILNILYMNEENISLANYKRQEICKKILNIQKLENIIL